MPRHQSSIAALQQALSMELTAVQQYLLHAHVLDDWGLDKLAAKMREEMQEELGHAGQFIDRILYLGGTPEVVPAKAPLCCAPWDRMMWPRSAALFLPFLLLYSRCRLPCL